MVRQPVNVYNDLQMVKEELRHPRLEPLEKDVISKTKNRHQRRKRVFFAQQTPEVKKAIKDALKTDYKSLVLEKVQLTKNF